jgi:hypothetical protein
MAKLLHPEGRIIIQVDEEAKNFHTFENGQTIRLERKWNNLNRREVAPVSGTVLSAANIPKGAEILFSHNTVHDVNRIFNYLPLGEEEANPDIKYYSVKETECFLWRMGENDVWHPCDVFATALRVFKPYNGKLQGIEPELQKNILWVTSGELKNKAVLTLKACDYVIVFRDSKTGQEDNIIRFRPFGDPITKRDEEAIAINNAITQGVKNGEYWIGLTPTTAKPLTKHATASSM